MIEALTTLRALAGVLFWGLADLALGAIWLCLIAALIYAIIRGPKQ